MLLVAVYHARLPVPGGFVGVDVFFVISGFVITAMLMREWNAHSHLRFGAFYFRRFLRLTPALALLVTVVFAASALLQTPFGPQQTTAITGLGAMLLSANFVIGHASGDYFADSASTNPLLNTWSLSIEEQFYLVFPALLAIGFALSRRRAQRVLPPVLIVLGIGFVSFCLSLLFSYGSTFADTLTDFLGGPETFAYFSPFTRAWEFSLGALLALLDQRLPPPGRATAEVAGLAGLVMLIASALWIDGSTRFPGFAALLPVVGTALLLRAGSGTASLSSRLLEARPLVFIGDISYSWYLWHWPVIVFAALLFPNRPAVLVVALVGSLVPAILSYFLLERPLRRMRPSTRGRGAGVVVATIGTPLLAGLGLVISSSSAGEVLPTAAAAAVGDAKRTVPAPRGPAESAALTLRAAHIAVEAGCLNAPLDPLRCRFGPPSPKGVVLLAGDSMAYALADGVIVAASELGYETIVTTHQGCPLLDRESSGRHRFPCRSWQQSIMSFALHTRPEVVIIANRSSGYVHPEDGWRTALTNSGERAATIEEAAIAWRQGLAPIVSTLRKAGLGLVLVHSVPQMTGFTLGTSLFSDAFGVPDFEISRDEVEAVRRPGLKEERAIAEGNPGTVTFDPAPLLCAPDTCTPIVDGVLRYQDHTHLTVAGSMVLVDGLREAMARAVAIR